MRASRAALSAALAAALLAACGERAPPSAAPPPPQPAWNAPPPAWNAPPPTWNGRPGGTSAPPAQPAWTSAPPPSPPPATAAPAGDRFANARQLCVDRTNEYRARAGRAAVVRRPDREACTDDEAAGDARAGSAHATFGRCGEGAQNACPNYPGASPERALVDCLESMFAEGPGEPYAAHGHYLNMTNPAYRGVACGFHVTPSGQLWIAQDFFR